MVGALSQWKQKSPLVTWVTQLMSNLLPFTVLLNEVPSKMTRWMYAICFKDCKTHDANSGIILPNSGLIIYCER